MTEHAVLLAVALVGLAQAVVGLVTAVVAARAAVRTVVSSEPPLPVVADQPSGKEPPSA